MRRLADLPGVDDLELKALMKPRFADPDMPEGRDEIDALSQAVFGLTLDEAEAADLPDDWDGVHRWPAADQAEAFEAEGWDVTDDKRRPLRVLGHFSGPLWLAVRGVAGSLPFQPEPEENSEAWVAKLEADAKRFIKR